MLDFGACDGTDIGSRASQWQSRPPNREEAPARPRHREPVWQPRGCVSSELTLNLHTATSSTEAKSVVAFEGGAHMVSRSRIETAQRDYCVAQRTASVTTSLPDDLFSFLGDKGRGAAAEAPSSDAAAPLYAQLERLANELPDLAFMCGSQG
jgi:hypothetical protein